MEVRNSMSDGIKVGCYAAVGGKVARVFTYGDGKTGVEVHVQDERMKYPDRYTAFGVTDEVAEGDLVEVRGWLSSQSEKFTKRDGTEGYGVKRTINAPKLAKREPAEQTGWTDESESPF
jgi:hypothetical protein